MRAAGANSSASGDCGRLIFRPDPDRRRAGSGRRGGGPPARRSAAARPSKRERVTVLRRAALTWQGPQSAREAAARCSSKRAPNSSSCVPSCVEYYAELLTDEVRAGLAEGGEGGEAWIQVVRQIGKDGWLGIGWPKEFGGQGRPAIDQFIFFDETRRAGAPFPFVTINTVGPTIMRFGTDEQKSFFLPQILAGELNFAIGYTEPEAGTDLASLRTRAVRDGEEYVVNGAKIFTSGADQADYVWLACRTDPDVPKHKGISILWCPRPPRASMVDHPHRRRTDDDADLLRRRARARDQPRRRRERGLAHDHHPAQPRAGRPGRWSGLASAVEDIVDWAAAQATDDGRRWSTSPGYSWISPTATSARRAEADHLAPAGNEANGSSIRLSRADDQRKVFGTETFNVYEPRSSRPGLGRLAQRGSPARRCRAGSRLRSATRRSSPSVVGSTRCSATSSPPPG